MTGQVREAASGARSWSTVAEQDGNQIIRNAEGGAELGTGRGPTRTTAVVFPDPIPENRSAEAMLTQRMRSCFRKVVEGHVELGQPVGSNWLSEQPSIDWSPSTIRTSLRCSRSSVISIHPTSAGRVPTDAGYR